MFGLIRVVFQKVFTQDDSVVLLVGEHRGLYVYILIRVAPRTSSLGSDSAPQQSLRL